MRLDVLLTETSNSGESWLASIRVPDSVQSVPNRTWDHNTRTDTTYMTTAVTTHICDSLFCQTY